MTKKCTLEVSEQQLQVLINALDLYTRVGVGQFEEVGRVYLNLGNSNKLMESYLLSAKVAAGHPTNGSHGIYNENVRDEFRQAFDIEQVIRNALAWERNPEGGYGVDFYEPYSTGGLPLPKVKIESEPELFRGEIPRVGEYVYLPYEEGYVSKNRLGGLATVERIYFDEQQNAHMLIFKECPGEICSWEGWLKDQQKSLKKKYGNQKVRFE